MFGEWAAAGADNQQKMFRYFAWTIFSYTLIESFGRAARQVVCQYINYVCSQELHKEMISKVMRAPVNLYFDVTPVGTIMNRFTKDLSHVENDIGNKLNEIVGQFFHNFSLIVILGMTNMYTLILFPVLFITMSYYYQFQRPVHKTLQKFDTIKHQKTENTLSETLSGQSTIKAFGRQAQFKNDYFMLLDEDILDHQFMSGTWNWIASRINFTMNMLVFFSIGILILNREDSNPVLVAMTL